MIFLYETNSQLEVTHIYKNIMLNQCLKQSNTGPHLETKECSPHIPTLIQNTFQYYPCINGYDFQKVSFLQACDAHFNSYMVSTIQPKAANS